MTDGLKGGKINIHKHTLPNRAWEAHPHDISFQVSSATDAHTHLESRVFNIAILPQTPDTPKPSLGASLHMTVSWMGRLVVSTPRRHADGFDGMSCFYIWWMCLAQNSDTGANNNQPWGRISCRLEKETWNSRVKGRLHGIYLNLPSIASVLFTASRWSQGLSLSSWNEFQAYVDLINTIWV